MVDSRKHGLDPQYEHDACGIGAVVDISGKSDHRIIEYGKQILLNLRHRGAAGADEVTGDGAGILCRIPHDFFAAVCKETHLTLGPPGTYAVGMVFGSRDAALREKCDAILADAPRRHVGPRLGATSPRTTAWQDRLKRRTSISRPVDGRGSTRRPNAAFS